MHVYVTLSTICWSEKKQQNSLKLTRFEAIIIIIIKIRVYITVHLL